MKILAYLCKVLAAILWVGAAYLKIALYIMDLRATTPPRDAPHDWGTPAYYHRTYLEIIMMLSVALLAVLPNCWLVFSRLIFGASIILALVPFGVCLIHDWSSDPFMSWRNYLDPEPWIYGGFVFGPLPLALFLSFWRQRKGAMVRYA